MKWNILSPLAIFIFSCSLTPENESPGEGGGSLEQRSIFEGVWMWQKTQIEGLSGTYILDSISEGYSMKYHFTDQLVEIYKNNKFIHSYTFDYTPVIYNSDGSVTFGELIFSTEDREEPELHLFWNIEQIDENSFLYIRNFQPWIDQYDYLYTQYFQKIETTMPFAN